MSPFAIASTLFSLFPSSDSTSKAQQNSATTTSGNDFSSSLTLRMAAMQAQSVNLLLGSTTGKAGASSAFDFLTGASSGNTGNSSINDLMSQLGLSTDTQGLSASGRNLSLFDPESAYKMMSVINSDDLTYKAQFSELSEMKTAVADLQKASQALSGVSESTDSEAIKAQLNVFAGQYNDWVKRFGGTTERNGLLYGTQAAEISLYELKQSVENVFNGAKDGFHGLRDLGFKIDPNTKLASVDPTQLSAALTRDKNGVVNTIDEFSANFAKSAELLGSSNNFIPNRLSNLDRVIDYISANKPSLQAEFGLGDPAKPSAQVTKALENYARMSII